MKKGFTLIEVILVVAIAGLLGSAVFVFSSSYRLTREVGFTATSLATVLRDAQQRSIVQEGGRAWGVRFEKSNAEFYKLFSTTDGTFSPANVVATYSLTSPLIFVEDLTWSGTPKTKDIIFKAITGLPTNPLDDTITIKVTNGTIARTITVFAASGAVNY